MAELLYVGLESVVVRFTLHQVILLYSSVCPCQQAGMLYDDLFQVCSPEGGMLYFGQRLIMLVMERYVLMNCYGEVIIVVM